MLWESGDRDGAQAAARNSLELARDTGDLHLQAWTLRALATIAADESLSDDVVQEFREVTSLTERSNDRGGHVWSLASYADVERSAASLTRLATRVNSPTPKPLLSAIHSLRYIVASHAHLSPWIAAKPPRPSPRCRQSCARRRAWAERGERRT